MNIKDRHVATAAVAFAITFGVTTCAPSSFLAGFFAGMATVLAFEIWEEDND